MSTVIVDEDRPELLSCPFCGGIAKLAFGEAEGRRVCRWMRVECEKCGASTGYFSTVREVISSWNDRCELMNSEYEGERILAAVPEMYSLIRDLNRVEKPSMYIPRFLELKTKARDLLARIDGDSDVETEESAP